MISAGRRDALRRWATGALIAGLVLCVSGQTHAGSVYRMVGVHNDYDATGASDYTWPSQGINDDGVNFGSSETVLVGSDDWRGGYHHEAFHRADLSAIPPAETVIHAELEMFLESMEHRDRADTLYVRRLTEPWTEGAGGVVADPGPAYDPTVPLTWNNRPADDGVAWASAAVGTHGIGDGPVNEWLSWDLTVLVAGWHDGTLPNYGMVMLATGTSGPTYRFRSDDFADPATSPRLVVETIPVETIPEPAMLALLSLAACGLGGYVRRRRKA